MNDYRPLKELIDPERETEPDFGAILDSQPVFVTAVLERTVVYHRLSDSRRRPEKFVARIDRILVRPEDVRHGHLHPQAWHGRPKPAVQT